MSCVYTLQLCFIIITSSATLIMGVITKTYVHSVLRYRGGGSKNSTNDLSEVCLKRRIETNCHSLVDRDHLCLAREKL